MDGPLFLHASDSEKKMKAQSKRPEKLIKINESRLEQIELE